MMYKDNELVMILFIKKKYLNNLNLEFNLKKNNLTKIINYNDKLVFL
jgi:hypothetical protein